MNIADKTSDAVVEKTLEPARNQIENRTTHQLTDDLAKALVCPAGKPNHDFRDERLTGFLLRVSTTGKKSWQVTFSVHGKKQRYKIGSFPAWSCAKASKRASEIIQEADRGKNPAATKRELRQGITFGDLVDAYEKDRRGTLRSIDAKVAVIRRYCSPWLTRRAVDITKQDTRDILADFKQRGKPHFYNQLITFISSLYKWALRQDLIPDGTVNPAANLDFLPVGDGRARYLDEGELRRFWRALADAKAYSQTFADAARISLLTGQREMEVGRMTWEELKLDLTDKDGNPVPAWDLPGARTKNGHAHHVPLTAPVVAILRKYAAAARQDGGLSGLVFWSRDKTPLDHDFFQDHMERIRKASGLLDIVFHDLRRTCSTWMATIGVDELTNDRVLNHRSGRKARNSVHAIYDRYEYATEKRAALERWASKLDEIVGGLYATETGKVQSISRAVA